MYIMIFEISTALMKTSSELADFPRYTPPPAYQSPR